jgi:hypothetical protein
MISGRGFANAATWIYDTRYSDKSFLPGRSLTGDSVFINGDRLDEFVKQKVSSIFTMHKKFVFIVHNSDLSFDARSLSLLLPHAVHIYAVNTSVRHHQLTTIPLGFGDTTLRFVKDFLPPTVDRDIEVYLNLTLGSPGERRHTLRTECIRAVAGDSRVVSVSNRSMGEYFMDLCRSKYVLCPEGTGHDTHRLYECIFCGAIPVVLSGPLNHFYQTLPVCIVNKWTDPYYEPSVKRRSLMVGDYYK